MEGEKKKHRLKLLILCTHIPNAMADRCIAQSAVQISMRRFNTILYRKKSAAAFLENDQSSCSMSIKPLFCNTLAAYEIVSIKSQSLCAPFT